MSYFTDLPGMEPSLFYKPPPPPPPMARGTVVGSNQNLAYPLTLPSPTQPYQAPLLSYNYWAGSAADSTLLNGTRNNSIKYSSPACLCSICSSSSRSSNASTTLGAYSNSPPPPLSSSGGTSTSCSGSAAYHHHHNAPAILSASSLHNLQQTPASPPYHPQAALAKPAALFANHPRAPSSSGHSLWFLPPLPASGESGGSVFGAAAAPKTGTPTGACAGTMDHHAPAALAISRPTTNNEIAQASCYDGCLENDKPDFCGTVTPAMSSATAANNSYGVWTPNQTPQHHHRPPTRQRKRKKTAPNWDDFYRNGYPAEIIVISDDEEPRVTKTSALNGGATSGYSSLSSTAELKSVGSYSHTSTADYEDYIESDAKRRKRNDDEYRQRQHIAMPVTANGNGVVTGGGGAAAGVVTGGLQPPVYVPPKQPIVKPSDVYVRPINERRRKNAKSCDDENGHYVVRENAEFADRYVIAKLLGQGTFGRVVAAYDKKSRTHCAIKIIRAVPKYRDASRTELRVLTALSRYDRENHNKCIHLRECFDFRNHICIVTDLLGISVFDFMHSNRFLPFPGSHIQSFTRQLLQSVSFLHDLTLVHTDLKPENILLIDDSYEYASFGGGSYYRGDDKKRRKVLRNTSIHLIDFGSAIFNDEHHSGVVSTRHYRAPEIVLGVGWSFPCDIWSLGCILVELYTGQTLFDTHEDEEHLALMEKIIGRPLDLKIANQACQGPASKLFTKDMRVNYPNAGIRDNSQQMVNATKTLEQIVAREPSYQRHRVFWDSFLDLLRRIFVYDPNERITARQALNHPWLQMSIHDEGSDSILS